MLAIPFLYFKLQPLDGTIARVAFMVLGTLCGVVALICGWILVTQWHTLTRGERWRLVFYFLFA